MKTVYDFGWAYAEWLVGEGIVEAGATVDIDKQALLDIPDGDHGAMKDAGIADPDPLYYWQGYNDYMTA